MLTDSHCHLDQLGDPEGALAEALARGVHCVVAVSEAPASMEKVLDLATRFPDGVRAGLGVHPVSLLELSEDAEREALSFLERHLDRASVIGEIGLDHKWATTDEKKERQLHFLRAQCELAARARLPINLHSRRAERAVLEEAVAFTKRTGLGAQLHWFTHSKKLVRIANDTGIYVSAGPSILHDEQSRKVAALVREDLLLLETDTPVPFQGESARPAWTRDVCDTLASLLDVPPEELARRTEENFVRFLGT
jgi:TatD DNase family protein